MPSQTDLDQGGTNRLWQRVWMGPSLGWMDMPSKSFLASSNSTTIISTAGTYTLDLSTNFVQVSVAGAVTIILPSVRIPNVAIAQPGKAQRINVTIVDVGGSAQAHPITIQPVSVAETIMGLTQIQITSNYGGFILEPVPNSNTWVNAQ